LQLIDKLVIPVPDKIIVISRRVNAASMSASTTAPNHEVPMARKQTLTLCARISPEGDALRTELQQKLDVPLHELVERGFRALKSELDEQRGLGPDAATA
jgi:hypothetical protein